MQTSTNGLAEEMRLRAALRVLREFLERLAALSHGSQLPASAAQLRRAGLTRSVLRSLQELGLVERVQGDGGSPWILTQLGQAHLRQLAARVSGEKYPAEDPATKPVWDTGRGELSYRGHMVLDFHKRRAPLLEALLGAFERAGWPTRLRPRARLAGSRERARQAIVRLNRRLRHTGLVFRMSDDGRTYSWSAGS